MEPANKPLVIEQPVGDADKDQTEFEFLPDADEIERRPLPRYARLTIHALAAMLICFVAWAAVAEVDEVVTARGRLATPSANFVVQPLDTSLIRSIDVRAGQVVRKGERLATLDPTDAGADQSQLRLRFDSLATEIRRLEAELAGGNRGPADTAATASAASADARLQDRLAGERRASFAAQAARIDENIARLRATAATNLRDQQSLDERVKSLREVETMQEKLFAQQFGAKANLLEARNRRMEVERDLELSRSRETEIARELAGLEAERRAFVNGWRQKVMEDMLALSRERDAIGEQMKKGELRYKLVELKAPVDAVVLEVAKLSPGAVVKAAEQMFTLVPIGSELDAEVQIDSLDVGQVKPGDVAHIKLDAFPFQKHGTLDARVRTLSEDAFQREQVKAGEGTDAYYVSRIGFKGSTLKKMDRHARLLPGMTLQAEIVVGKRTVLSYLMWPLTKGLDEAIREP